MIIFWVSSPDSIMERAQRHRSSELLGAVGILSNDPEDLLDTAARLQASAGQPPCQNTLLLQDEDTRI